jgi:hypothetical protein
MHLGIWDRITQFCGFAPRKGIVICHKVVFVTLTGKRVEKNYCTAEGRGWANQEIAEIAGETPEEKRWYHLAVIRLQDGHEIEMPWTVGHEPDTGKTAHRHRCRNCGGCEWSREGRVNVFTCFSCHPGAQVPR